METIEEAVKLLFGRYAVTNDKFNDAKVIETLSDLISALIDSPDFEHMKLFEINMDETLLILQQIGSILNIPFQILVSDGKIQSMESFTLKRMLTDISSEHCHNMTVDGKKHTCDYHLESLFVHLHLAMLIAIANCPKDETYENKLVLALTALLHDIGKRETKTAITVGTNKWIKYPYHGEMGCGILMSIWNDKFLDFITLDKWKIMCRTISVHMCGYHETHKEHPQTLYKWELLRLESTEVQKQLRRLSYGDHFGAVRDESIKENPADFITSRDHFESFIAKAFDMEEFMHKFAFKNIMIMVRGMSASGKSTHIKKLREFFDAMRVSYYVIERDEIMCRIVAKELGELSISKAVGETYARYYDEYGKRKLGGAVNEELKHQITEAWKRGEVVILDTVMSLFKGIELVLPQPMVRNAFIIAHDINRNCLITKTDADRMAMPVDQQISIFGTRSPFFWMHKDAHSRLSALTSVSTSQDIRNIRDVSKPRLIHVFAWNKDDKNNIQTYGYDQMFAQFEQIFAHLKLKEEITSVPSGTDETNMGIIEYAQYLIDKYGFEGMCSTIQSRGFLVNTPHQFKGTEDEKKFVMIKYLDNCPLWKPLWAREARGVVLHINDENKVSCIKFLLHRGAEVLTGLHIKSGIDETQDVAMKFIDILDAEQKDTISKLSRGEAIIGKATSKVDGSLLGIGFYSGSYYELMKSTVEKYGDEFTKAIVETASDLELEFIPVFNTQGTLFMGDQMQAYMATAIINDGAFPYNALKDDIKENALTPAQALKKYLAPFMIKLNKLYGGFIEKYGKHEVITASFEAVCKQRTSAWGDVHVELAISYPESMVRFLGLSYGASSVNYLPHTELSEILHYAEIYEPLYWNISHTVEVEKLLTDLTKCARGMCTVDEFLLMNPPKNTGLYTKHLDYEGFVFYRIYTNSDETKKYVYSKIKTNEYYKAHKFRQENIGYLLELSDTNIFPIAVAVREFFVRLDEKIKVAIDMILDVTKQSPNPLFDGLEEKAKISYQKQVPETQTRMLIGASKNWNEVSFKIFGDVFPSILTAEDKDDVRKSIKAIVNVAQPWSSKYEDNVKRMVLELDESLKTLFVHVAKGVML
jgi:hypothetical protein